LDFEEGKPTSDLSKLGFGGSNLSTTVREVGLVSDGSGLVDGSGWVRFGG